MSILQGIGACAQAIGTTNGLFISLFLAGLVGGFTHCVAMCGPFVLSQTKNLEKISQFGLFPYHLGRITTYVFLAILFSSVLNLAFLFAPLRSIIIAPMLFIAGTIFILTALPRLCRYFPWLMNFQSRGIYKAIAPLLARISGHQTLLSQYGMGVLLGFMPCGLIVSAIMAASTAPHPVNAGIAMMFFGLGTMPALLSVAFFGNALRERFPNAMPIALQGMMVWSGIWLFLIAGYILI